MNISAVNSDDLDKLSKIFHLLSQPARLSILLAIGEQEICVCHLETLLKERQAYISQQLMFLKDAGLVDCRREGRNIYYHLTNDSLLGVIRSAAVFSGHAHVEFEMKEPVPGCPCPRCNPNEKDCLSDSCS